MAVKPSVAQQRQIHFHVGSSLRDGHRGASRVFCGWICRPRLARGMVLPGRVEGRIAPVILMEPKRLKDLPLRLITTHCRQEILRCAQNDKKGAQNGTMVYVESKR